MAASRLAPTDVSQARPPRSLFGWLDTNLLIPGIAVAILVYLTIVPIARLLLGSFQIEIDPVTGASVFTLENYLRAYTTSQTYTTFVTSVLYATGSTALGLFLGLSVAWIVERTDTPFRQYFYILSLVPLLMPGLLVTVAWIFLLNPRIGWINSLIANYLGVQSPFSPYGLGGMIWVEGLRHSTLAFLLLSAAFKSMDPSLEEAATTSGAGTWASLRRVAVPLLLPAIASTGLLLFVQALDGFEVPALLGIPGRTFVFTSEIYLALRSVTSANQGYAAALSVGLLAICAGGVYLYNRIAGRREEFQTITGKAFRPRVASLGAFRWVTLAFLVLYVVLVAVLPFIILLWTSLLQFYQTPDWSHLQRFSLRSYELLFNLPQFQRAFTNSMILGVLSATGVMLLTTILSWIIIKTRLPGRSVLDYLAFLPIGIPGLVLGVSFLWLYLRFPIAIYGTIWLMLLAYITKYLPYGMRASSGTMVQIHKELEEAATASGASWWAIFTRIILPLMRPGFVAGWIYVFIISVRELSTSILLASSDSIVLSIIVVDLQNGGQGSSVAALAVMLILTMVIVVGTVIRLTGRIGLRTF